MGGFFLTLTFCFMMKGASAALPSWNMHYVCGQIIAQTEKGGFLVFDSDLLPAGHQRACRVVIQPAPTARSSASKNYVLFHFSGFEVADNCQDTNVTVQDGNGFNTKQIVGLKSPMCGTNSTLTNAVTFTTQSSYLTVAFQRDKSALNVQSRFNMTFLSFSEGSCESDDVSLFSCTIGRCVDNEFVCQNLNPCGDNSDCPVNDKIVTAGEIFGIIIPYIIVFVIFVVVIPVFCCKIVKRSFRSGQSPVESLCDCCGEFWGGILKACRRQLNFNQTQGIHEDSRVEQSTPNMDGPDRGSRRGSGTLGIDLPTSQNYSTFDATESQDFDDNGETGSFTNRPPSYRRLKPSAPPLLSETAEHELPSYDEVAANEEKYLRKNYD